MVFIMYKLKKNQKHHCMKTPDTATHEIPKSIKLLKIPKHKNPKNTKTPKTLTHKNSD